MCLRYGLPTLLGLVLLVSPVSAQDRVQDSAQGQTQHHADQCLAFGESLRIAAERAPEVDGARALQVQAEADLREAESLRWPQLSTFARSGMGDSGLTGSQIDNQVGVQVSQRVMDFGDARLARYAALASVYQHSYNILDQQMQAASTVAEAYLSKLEAEEMVAVISERRVYFGRQQTAVDALLARGGATRAESAQVAAQLAESEADVLELIFQVESASTRIAEFTGRPADLCDVESAGHVMDTYLAGLDTIDLVVDAALSQHPQIGARRYAINNLEARMQRERLSRLPVVEVVGIASYTYDDFREDWDFRDRVGVDVSIPLLSGNAIGARRDRINAQLSYEQSNLRALQRAVREDAEVTFRRTISLHSQLVRREAVAQSQRDYFEAISGEFEFGLGTLPDLIRARLDYERATLDVVSARYALLRQKLGLMQLTAQMPMPDGR
jgi:outer membrane protein